VYLELNKIYSEQQYYYISIDLLVYMIFVVVNLPRIDKFSFSRTLSCIYQPQEGFNAGNKTRMFIYIIGIEVNLYFILIN